MGIASALLRLIGSLAFLLYGMRLMSSGIQKSAGESLQRALSFMTGNRFVGFLTGLLITMLIQSSGATTVMVVSFVNARLLTLNQSVGVIFGANIGTTITAWIVSLFGFNFDIAVFALPCFGVGFFMDLFLKNQRYKNFGEAIMGFGLLFLGLDGLKDTFSIAPENLDFLTRIQEMGALSFLASFLISIFLTALMHSSSACTAIVITLAFQGLISWKIAAIMTLGSNIGSTIDALLASIGASANARRAALIHVMFNVFGTALALIFFTPLLSLVVWLAGNANIAIRIALLHTVFNTLTAIIMFPLANPLVKISQKIIKDNSKDKLQHYHLDFQDSVKQTAAMHIVQVEKEIADMTDVVTQMFDRLQIGFSKRNQDFIKNHMALLENEENYCDQMHEQLVQYILRCEYLPISEHQRTNLSIMLQVTDELEAMSDECFSTGELIRRSIEKKMSFPDDDMEQLVPYVELARQFLQFIRININKHLDENKLALASELEDQIDWYRTNLRKLGRRRLESGADVRSELLYLDVVRRIEKIGDRAFSISGLLAQTV